MKRHVITVLGRSCTIVTEKDEAFMRRIEEKINKELKSLRVSMPHADLIDLSIVYLFLLYERIDNLENMVRKMKSASEQAKRIIHILKTEIGKELTNLNRHNKI
ncbi:MAG: cell division protein ZapA [Candidatus Omnitrophica bacterium]|nr:cell division protein ZapA [Candidatus Omnitrophota bacterium]